MHRFKPASGACSSSAAQPVSKKRTVDTEPSGGASGSAARPATLSEQVEQQVDRLGHYPKRFKTPKTDKEHAESSLADKIGKQWSKLSDATKAKLTRLREETQSKHAEKQAERRAEDVLERLRAFGKWPQEHEYSHASNTDIITEARLALQTHDKSWQT